MPALPGRRRVKIWARAIEPDCYEGSILNSLIICLDNGVHFTDLYCHPNEKENQSGVIELMIELELDMPDEFDLLHDKLKDSVQSSDLLADELEDTVESKQQSSGCLGIIGDIGSGLLIYNWLFGK